MRLLHTSDWHLGQNFMGRSREIEHRAFINWLLKSINTYAVDVLVIAGDLFDTSTPPSYARKLYNDFIVELRNNGDCSVVIVGGNHDSVATLEESRELLAYLNVSVIGGVKDNLSDQVIVLTGANQQPEAILCAIPYVRPRDVVNSQAGQSQHEKQQILQTAIADHYAAVYSHACQVRETINTTEKLPIIATGHLATVGSTLTESVRDIYIGTLEAFSVDYFPPVDYMALGHLHKPQQVGANKHIRYSGSPIALSFDEISTDKQVLLVNFADGQLDSVEPLLIPRFKHLHSIKGSLTELEDKILQLKEPDNGSNLWLDVEVTEEVYLSDISKRIEEMVEGHAIEILRIRRTRNNLQTEIERQDKETLSELTVNEVFERRLSLEQINDETKQRLDIAFREIVASALEREVEA